MRSFQGPVLWAVLLLLAATLPVGAQVLSGREVLAWDTFTCPDGAWSVAGPGAHEVTEAATGDLRYTFPPSAHFEAFIMDKTYGHDLLARGEDAYFTGLLEALSKDHPVTSSSRISVNGWPGVRFVKEGDGVTLHYQVVVYKRKRTIRSVLGTTTGTQVDDETERFLGSLRFLEAAAR